MPHQMKQESKIYNKIKSCKSFWNAKCYEFYIYRWIYSQHNYPRYMQLPKQEWKNDNHIHHWTWQILTATVIHSTNDGDKFIAELNFIINWNDFTLKRQKHTHTHTNTHTHTKPHTLTNIHTLTPHTCTTTQIHTIIHTHTSHSPHTHTHYTHNTKTHPPLKHTHMTHTHTQHTWTHTHTQTHTTPTYKHTIHKET